MLTAHLERWHDKGRGSLVISRASNSADSDGGRDMRRRIAAEGGAMKAEEMEGMGIPRELRRVLKRLRRVQGAEPSLYREVLDEMTALADMVESLERHSAGSFRADT